jgi:hypothetical protein
MLCIVCGWLVSWDILRGHGARRCAVAANVLARGDSGLSLRGLL